MLVAVLAALGLTVASPRPGEAPSTARVALLGKTYQGNLASQTPDKSGYRHALWKVRLRAGMTITVRWSQPAAGQIWLNVLPGVTDRNWSTTQPLLTSVMGSYNSNGGDVVGPKFVLPAATTAWYYLVFTSPPGHPARYSFGLSR